jgi:hypothetical protein
VLWDAVYRHRQDVHYFKNIRPFHGTGVNVIHFIPNGRTAFAALISAKITNDQQNRVEMCYRILPISGVKCGKYEYKYIYTPN